MVLARIKRYSFSLCQKSIELCGFFKKKGVSIFMFHQVNDDTSEWKNNDVSIRLSSFKWMINELLNNGYEIISIENLADNINKKAVVLTFDDVLFDTIDNAIPFLSSLNIPFTLFISDEFIDKKGYLSHDQLLRLSGSPLCTIGFHSKSHTFMRNLTKEQIAHELSADSLEEMIYKKIDYFAFPYGSVYACGFGVSKLAKEKYNFAFSTISANCTSYWLKNYPYYLPRINVNEQNFKALVCRLINT